MSAIGQVFERIKGKVSAQDDPCKRTLAVSCSCGCAITVWQGRHSGKWLLRHEQAWQCPLAGTWLHDTTREAVVRQWQQRFEKRACASADNPA